MMPLQTSLLSRLSPPCVRCANTCLCRFLLCQLEEARRIRGLLREVSRAHAFEVQESSSPPSAEVLRRRIEAGRIVEWLQRRGLGPTADAAREGAVWEEHLPLELRADGRSPEGADEGSEDEEEAAALE